MYFMQHFIQMQLTTITSSISLQAAGAIERAKKAKHKTWGISKLIRHRWLLRTRKDVMDQLQEAQLAMDNALKNAIAEYESKMKSEAEAKCSYQVKKERKHFWEKAMKAKAATDAKLEAECHGCRRGMMRQQWYQPTINLSRRCNNSSITQCQNNNTGLVTWQQQQPELIWMRMAGLVNRQGSGGVTVE